MPAGDHVDFDLNNLLIYDDKLFLDNLVVVFGDDWFTQCVAAVWRLHPLYEVYTVIVSGRLNGRADLILNVNFALRSSTDKLVSTITEEETQNGLRTLRRSAGHVH